MRLTLTKDNGEVIEIYELEENPSRMELELTFAEIREDIERRSDE